jgi:hypothetical protein
MILFIKHVDIEGPEALGSFLKSTDLIFLWSICIVALGFPWIFRMWMRL